MKISRSLVIAGIVVVLTLHVASGVQGLDLEKVCYQRGQELIKARKFAEAAKQFETVTNLNPQRADAFYRLGLCHGRSKQLLKAVRALNRSLFIAPGNKMAYKLIGAYEKKLKVQEQYRVPVSILQASVNPEAIAASGQALLAVQARVSHKDGPKKILTVTAELGALKLGRKTLVDNGMRPDKKSNDGVYTVGFTVPKGTPTGLHPIEICVYSKDYDATRRQVSVNVFKTGGYTVKINPYNDDSIMVSQGKVAFTGGIIKNNADLIAGFSNLDTGQRKPGTDYFVYVVATPGVDKFRVVFSNSWVGPTGFHSYKLIGYFHNDPNNKILSGSVVTNDNLDGTTLDPGIPLPGMVRVGDFAIDIYENSRGEEGLPVSRCSRQPWVHLPSITVKRLAKKIGKRIPTAAEWFQAARGTPDPHTDDPGDGSEPCNIWMGSIPQGAVGIDGTRNYPDNPDGVQTGYILTGTAVKAYSNCGCYDMIGNAWEWTSTLTTSTSCMENGYVQTVDSVGLPQETNKEPVQGYNLDWARFNPNKLENLVYARGGCCNTGAEAGIYAINGLYLRVFGAITVGFRLVR